jgi:hypothetical protein
MIRCALFGIAVLSFAAIGCAAADNPASPTPSPGNPQTGTRIVREMLTGAINATTTPGCSPSFKASVDPSYFLGGTQRCMEFPRRSVTAGIITARLTWQQTRLDLDLVLNNGAGMNFRQSIAANRCCETVEFFVNGGTDYAFVVYLRGVDPQFLANGGIYTGDVATPFTLDVERPE